MGHSLGCHRPLLPLEGRSVWAEVKSLSQQFPICPSSIARKTRMEFLRSSDFRLFNFQEDLVDRLWGVEGKGHALLTQLPSDPASASQSTMGVEGKVNGMVGSL